MGQPAVLLIMSGVLVDVAVAVVDVAVVDDELLQALITSIPTTRTAARTEGRKIFIFIFQLPLSFVIHPPRGGNCVQCRKGRHADKHKRLWVLDHMISSYFSSFTLHRFQYSRLKNRHARGEHFLHGTTNQSTPWLTRSILFRMTVR